VVGARRTDGGVGPSNSAGIDAARTGRAPTTPRAEGGGKLAQVARPLLYQGRPSWVVVFSEPLDEVDENVGSIQRQILIAGLLALLLATTTGYFAANALARRVKRLERGAREVAGGNFSEPIPIDSDDELGQLARAFNEMQHRLARLDSARKEFIANASHELRTPIFSLGGFVELLETDNPSAKERREFVGEMRGQVDRLQKLTLDLLDLSRLDADAMEINLERVDLTETARNVAGEFKPTAKGRDSRLEVRGRGQAEALADPDRVSQIIRILIDNALTHTPEGTKVTVTAVRGDRAAELIVGDDGKKGLDARARERVFDRFYTGNSASGSGLGLAIADELASRMGGGLEVASQRGYTAFTLSLPLAGQRSRMRRPTGAAA